MLFLVRGGGSALWLISVTLPLTKSFAPV